jgi:vacuolar-type H+-ATPase subunit H
MGRRSDPVPHAEPAEDALDKLLTAEEKLAQRLDAARADAEQLLQTARSEAASAEDACAATIEERSRQLVAEYDARLQAELADIRLEAERVVRRFEAVDDTRLNGFVERVIARLLEVGRSGGNGAEAAQ